MSHSPYSELQSHLLATATRQQGRTHGRNTSRKTVGRELLDSTNYPPPLIGVSPLPPRSVTRTTRRDSRAACEEGQQHLFYRHGHRHQQFPQWAMYREWDQLPEGRGMGSHIPASSCSQLARRGRDSGDLGDLLPGQGCPFPPSGAHTVSGIEGHPARGGEGVSLTPPTPAWSHCGHCPTTASSTSHRPGGDRTADLSSLPATFCGPKTPGNLCKAL